MKNGFSTISEEQKERISEQIALLLFGIWENEFTHNQATDSGVGFPRDLPDPETVI